MSAPALSAVVVARAAAAIANARGGRRGAPAVGCHLIVTAIAKAEGEA